VSQLLQQLVNGLVLGATYGLIALGYTMVYGIIQLINFAHGEIYMLGAFGGLTMWKALPTGLQTKNYIALPLVLLAGIVTSTVVAVLMERWAYRPLRGAPRLAPLITAIGVSVFLQEAVRVFYPGAKGPLAFPALFTGKSITIGGVEVKYLSIFVVALAVALMIALQAFVRTSSTGRAMRATAQDPDTAALMGIDINRIIVITFALGGVLAGVAGVLTGMQYGAIDVHIGYIAGLKAFTAAVLGGIGNITGAMLGGFLIGIIEALGTQYLPQGSAYKDAYAFVVLILVLVFRPTGLLGESVAARA
jgi:branched-chain amino acid transport system permease protein